VAGKDVAFLHCIERVSGTLKGGQKSDIWLRATSGLRKIKGKWLITHDHISVPVDFESGKAALELKP
jgi:ketosteroid isomerase-like protein